MGRDLHVFFIIVMVISCSRERRLLGLFRELLSTFSYEQRHKLTYRLERGMTSVIFRICPLQGALGWGQTSRKSLRHLEGSF